MDDYVLLVLGLFRSAWTCLSLPRQETQAMESQAKYFTPTARNIPGQDSWATFGDSVVATDSRLFCFQVNLFTQALLELARP